MSDINFLHIFDLIGTFAFAISGALAGAKKQMDIYGIFVLSIVTAVGGGVFRDLLIGKVPPFVFLNFSYLLISIIGALIVFFFYKNILKIKDLLIIMDAIGLGIFTVIGVSYGIQYNITWYGSIFLGLITGTVGGMIRDVLRKEVPFVLRKNIYASASILGAATFYLLKYFNFEPSISIFISSIIVTFIRIITYYKDWHLPIIKK